MANIYKIEGKFDKKEDVVIEYTKIIERSETRKITVGEIEKRLETIDKDIGHLEKEKASLLEMLDENKTKINNAVK